MIKLLRARTGMVVPKSAKSSNLDERLKELLKGYCKQNFESFFENIILLLKY